MFRTFQTPEGRAGTAQLYGMQESINSHLGRMFDADARRSVLQYGVGRTVSTFGGVDSKVQLHAQQREYEAAITFHAGKAAELSMQLVYAFGTDRIMGREYPGVAEKIIEKDVKKGHSLRRLYHRILNEMKDRDMKNAFEDAYQKALNRGVVDVEIDGRSAWSEFATVEDVPFRENAIRLVEDGMEITHDHTEVDRLLFPSEQASEFAKMPIETFAQFLTMADTAYYEGDIADKEGETSRKNMRWADYSARDHEYGREYAVAGITFFARLVKELVGLANQQWIWHPDFSLRWWQRKKYNIAKLLENHAMQNFRQEVEFPEMVSAEEARDSFSSVFPDPELSVKRGYASIRRKRVWPLASS